MVDLTLSSDLHVLIPKSSIIFLEELARSLYSGCETRLTVANLALWRQDYNSREADLLPDSLLEYLEVKNPYQELVFTLSGTIGANHERI